MRISHFPTLALLSALYFVSSAQAQECGPLKRAISLDLETNGNGHLVTVPVKINGVPKKFILNTEGGNATFITSQAVADLGLKPVEDRTMMMLYSSGKTGNISRLTADVGVGPMVVKQYTLLVDPSENPTADGSFPPDLMANYDIEMDFSGHKLNYFLTDHCDGRVVYWPNSAVGVVEYRGWDMHGGDENMRIPVKLDGHELIAVIETGTEDTVLDANTARQLFDLSPDSPGATPLGTVAGQVDHKIFGWDFKTLEFGDVTVRNPRMKVRPDLFGKKSDDTLYADSRLRRFTDNTQPSMQIGMDVLSKLHLYIAAKEKKLYVTAAAPQVSTPQATASEGTK